MTIANPIYDITFKRFLENDHAARFFVGTILAREVFSLVHTILMLPITFVYILDFNLSINSSINRAAN